MDARTLRVLEWEKVVEGLSLHCSTELGRQEALLIAPSDDRLIIEEAMSETTASRNFVDSGRQVIFGGVKDIRESVIKAGKGLILSGLELSSVNELVARARSIKKQIWSLDGQYEALKGLVWNIREHKELEQQLTMSISPAGEVLDSASPELAGLRSRISTLSSRLRDKLDDLVRRPDIAKYLQEPIVSIRAGRFVVPVRSEFKSQVKGIVHDQSSSGATLFIEPMSVVEANNDLKEAESAESEEVERLLALLSAKVADASEDIVMMVGCLARLDFVLAKGKYSQAMGMTEPALTDEPRFRYDAARHPLLKGDVVPIDAYLGEGFSTLVITGPNTGGKTVALKTMGLLQLMAQAGLHVPADKGCAASVFQGIFADIGDEQSIEQSLSTFSGHLRNIVDILSKAGERSLVLLDELGAGTDPEEGAALAMSILDRLFKCGACTIATTHYKELKVYAHLNAGMRNASVEFDLESLKPTYKLTIGMPGSSNAFAIAERLGLDKSVIERAKGLVGSGDRKVEDMINSLRGEYEAAALARKDAEILRRRAEESSRKLSEELAKVRSERAEVLRSTRAEARELVRLAREETESIIDTLRKGGSASFEEAAKTARKSVESLKSFVEDEVKEESAAHDELTKEDISKLKPGDPIELLPSGMAGVLLELKGDKARAAVGSIKTEIPISMIRRGKAASSEKTIVRQPERQTQIGLSIAQNISVELDLRGLRADEAMDALEKRLDEALLAGIPMLRIIHGKGTGALRAAVRERLSCATGVESFRLGAEGEGGDGVTIVKFQQ